MRRRNLIIIARALVYLLWGCWCGPAAWAADVFIDPGNAGDPAMDGSLAHPYDQWAKVSWASGNSYLQKRGTVAYETVLVGASGTISEPIILGAYGTGARPIIDGGWGSGTERDYCLRTMGYDYLRIEELEFRKSKGCGMEINVETPSRGSNDLVLDNLVSHDHQYEGFYLVSYWGTTPVSRVTTYRCKAYNNGGAGFHHVFAVEDVTHWYAEAYNNGLLHAAHGFSSIPERETASSGWSAFSGTTYFLSLAPFTNLHNVTRVVNQTDGPNELTHRTGQYTNLGLNEWDLNGGNLFINIGNSPNGKEIRLVNEVCRRIRYLYCSAHDNVSSVPGEGHGFDFDDYTSDSEMFGCTAENNQGAGFVINGGKNCSLRYCSSRGNAAGSGVWIGSFSRTTVVENLTLQGNQTGLSLGRWIMNASLRNLIIANNAQYGLDNYYGATVSGLSADYLCLFNNTWGDLRDLTPGAHTLTGVNPLFVNPGGGDLQLQFGSPCIDQGVYTGVTLDAKGNPVPLNGVQDIGAFEYVPAARMLGITWTEVPFKLIYSGTQSNCVGQIVCNAYLYDRLTSLTVENLGTAESNADLTRVRLWKQAGTGGALEFNPVTAEMLADLTPVGNSRWTAALSQVVNDQDVLFLTADISSAASTDRTCRFSIPDGGAVFQVSQPQGGIANTAVQVIKNANVSYIDCHATALVNLVWGQTRVPIGDIVITNSSGNVLALQSLTLGLTDKSGQTCSPDAIFARLWVETGAGQVVATPPSLAGSPLSFTFPVSQLIQNQSILMLKIYADLAAHPALSGFRLQVVDGQCLNGGQIPVEPAPGKVLPLILSESNLRAPTLVNTFSNFPNPFVAGKGVTVINYYLNTPAEVRLDILSFGGESIRRLVDGPQGPGMQTLSWDGKNERGNTVRNGIYLLKLTVRFSDGASEVSTRRVAVIK